ncbi:MAG: type II toxin-antitoxin system VapC family toxin [Armatimonadetes bacterium]|nr:type II toxin-antitoxin system VapC family toxin [Armatimonadota bacterium]
MSHGTGLLDALVAATAIRFGLAVATFNSRHFSPFGDLTVVEPYSRTRA